MTLIKRTGIVILVVLVVVFALIGLLSTTRGTPVQMVISEGAGGPPAVSDTLFARTFELYTGTHIEEGNQVVPVNNGTVYDSLWRDLRAARQTITVQMYYSLPGRVADTLAAILAERARAHVRVLLLLDAFGSQHVIGDWTDRLKGAGVEVATLRPLRWYTIHEATNRSHVRVVVVDGTVGYTGGFGLADYWLGDGHHEEQWRESNVRFVGPAVMELQAAFAAAWAEATGELLAGPLFFPRATFTAHPGRSAPGCSTRRRRRGARRRSDSSLSRSPGRGARSTSPTRTSSPTTTSGGSSSGRGSAAWTCGSSPPVTGRT